jgi:hypothetical protein
LKKKYFFSPQIHRQQDIPAQFCFLKKAKNWRWLLCRSRLHQKLFSCF